MTLQDKHKKIASRKWQQARGGKTATSDREATQSTTTTRPPTKGRPLALANPLPSGKQNSDDDSDENDEESEGEGSGEDGNAQASTSSQPDAGESEEHPRFGRRKLVSNQDRYEEKTDTPIPGEEEESDGEATHEMEQLTAFLARQRLALDSTKDSPLAAVDAIPEDDIDHSLRSTGASSAVARRNKEKLAVRAGEGSLAEMSVERAKADALSDVKARLLAGRDAGTKRRVGGRPESSRAPAKTSVEQADDVDDFLNMI